MSSATFAGPGGSRLTFHRGSAVGRPDVFDSEELTNCLPIALTASGLAVGGCGGQGATSHQLGQTFGRIFGIAYEDPQARTTPPKQRDHTQAGLRDLA